jgi:protein-S-isoprenylcysteine O-methyltransferase Ste14
VINSRYSRNTFRIRDFLAKNQVPYTWLDLEADPQVSQVLRQFGVSEADTPVVAWGKKLLRNPSNRELAEALGIRQPLEQQIDDLVVVGAGPAGLLAAPPPKNAPCTPRPNRVYLCRIRHVVHDTGGQTMAPDVWRWTESAWLLVGIYWLVTALRAKPVARRERLLTRVVHLAIMTVACVLLFSGSARVGVLGARPLPESAGSGWAGLGLTVAGCAFAVWARAWLGPNWSATVTRKQGHELVRSGPYAVVRHPIYAGLLLAILGTALALGEVRGLVALALAFVGWFTKARTEERFLVEEFGDRYLRYRREVKQLIPFVL